MEFVLSGIHVITGRLVQGRRRWGWGNGSKHVKGTINHQLQKFTPLPRACILSDRNTFCSLRGGKTATGSNVPGAFLVYKKKFLRHKFNFTDVVLIKWHMITYSMPCKRYM